MDTAPAPAIPVGRRLRDALHAYGWTQAEFAEILDRPIQRVSEIVTGQNTHLTLELAAQISAALGTSTDIWTAKKQTSPGRESVATRGRLDDIRLRARLYDLAPVAELREHGVITAATAQSQAEQLCELLEIADIHDQPQLPTPLHSGTATKHTSRAHFGWLACVRRQARQTDLPPYSRERLHALAKRLGRETRTPSAFAALPARFAEAGVRLVHVEAFPSARLDGAAFDDDGTPVIGLSGRERRLDKVLTRLLQATAHVFLGHTTDVVLLGDHRQPGEAKAQRAHNLADSWLLPEPLGPVPEKIRQVWLRAEASAQGVHPVIILGRLQDTGILSRKTILARDAPTVTRFLRGW